MLTLLHCRRSTACSHVDQLPVLEMEHRGLYSVVLMPVVQVSVD